jgi:NADH-quinone oxidoreductase subunit C
MDEALRELGEYIAAALGDDVTGTEVAFGELMVSVPGESVAKVMTFLRDDAGCQCKVLVDICGADYPAREKRFDVIYNLLSLTHNHRVRVKAATDENTPVPSVVAIYSNAGWYEREAWDMYGIMFAGHPDLRRMLSDYGFDGHPLRKDFPLTGYVEVRYDETEKRVVYEPVSLTQDYRRFDFMSPWEGADYALPGDEKADPAAEPGGKGKS